MFFKPVSTRASSEQKKLEALLLRVKSDDSFITEQPDTAISYYHKATKLMKIFHITAELKFIKNALACYTQAIKLDPENALYFIERAVCLINMKENEGAVADLSKTKSLPKVEGLIGKHIQNQIKDIEEYFKFQEPSSVIPYF